MSKLSRMTVATLIGVTIMQPLSAAVPDAATDPRISPQVRAFLKEVNKDPSPFWTLPGPQVRATLTGLQAKSPRDLSGIVVSDRMITEKGHTVHIYVVKPEGASGTLPVILFIHGGVWIAGNFENHEGLVRDLVVGTGAAAVFVDYTSIPDAIYPTQVEQNYAVAEWVVAHGADIGVDGSRMVVAGNSVGGDMSAALTLMAKDRHGPKIRLQVLMIPAVDAGVDTDSYREFATGRFLTRDFMKFGWDIYAPDEKTRAIPYVSPLRASIAELRGLPPALVITAENDPLRDEGEAYARKLKEAGVSVIATRYNGTIHDFVTLNGVQDDPASKAAILQACDAIRSALSE